MRRDDVASTLNRRHFRTKCLLGTHFSFERQMYRPLRHIDESILPRVTNLTSNNIYEFYLNTVINSVKLVPGSRFLGPGSWFPVSGSRFLLPCSCFPVSGSWFLVSGSCFPVPASRFPLPRCRFLLPCFLFPVHCSQNAVKHIWC